MVFGEGSPVECGEAAAPEAGDESGMQISGLADVQGRPWEGEAGSERFPLIPRPIRRF